MKHTIQKAALAAAISIALSTTCFADEAQRNTLGTVQVTASRIEKPVAEALASVTVITRQDIELAQAPDLVNLLSRQAGVDIARNGGPGQASTLFLRGTNSSHTLVLVDGVRVNAATQGVIDFAHIPLAQIERIEIVRGPRAALWGSDAIGGVVQIFTRDASKGFFEAKLGSNRLAGATAGFGIARDDSSIGLSAGAERLEGFSATNEAAFGYDPDVDGYRNRNLAVGGKTGIGSQTLSVTGLVTDAEVDFDAGTEVPGEGRTQALNRVFGLGLRGPVSEGWTQALTLGRSSEDLDTPAYFSRFGSTRDSLDWVNALAIRSGQSLGWGVNWSRETGYSDEGFQGFEASRRNAAAFVTWQGGFGAHTFDASLRHDQNSQFGGASTGNLAWGWRANDSLRLRASWGQGFRAPNFNELYYPGFDLGEGLILFAGNPDLQPERSRSSEIGLDWQMDDSQSLGLSAYRTRINDLIAFDGPLLDAINIRSAAIDGIELDYLLVRGGLTIRSNATWQDARDSDTGERLLRRANRKLHASADYSFANGASTGIDLSAVSPRPDFGGSMLPGYSRIDLRASAPLGDDWTVDARIENVGGVRYELVQGYNTPGRTGVIALRWQAR
jgi:vitamin B12 transporter